MSFVAHPERRPAAVTGSSSGIVAATARPLAGGEATALRLDTPGTAP